MDGSQPTSISAQDLYRSIGTAVAPIVIDVRRSAAFAADNRMIVGAVRRNPEEVQDWRRDLPSGRVVVVYCVRGQEMSQGAASALQAAGVDACYLENGIAGWAEHRLPMRNRRETEPRSWVTRERPKIDRIACPWLVRRFIDPEAEFLFAPTERVFALPARPGPLPTTSPAPSLSRTTASCAASMPS
jgi:rhodanese-related sulfurtransferase